MNQQLEIDFPRGDQLGLLAKVQFDGRCGVSTKAVLRAIDDFGRECFASQDTIADRSNTSTRTVRRAIAVLVTLSLITCERKRNKFGTVTNHYRIVWTELEQFVRRQSVRPIGDSMRPIATEHEANCAHSVRPIATEHEAMVTSKPTITEKEPPPTAKGGGGGWDDVLNRLQARSVARASEAIEAAQEAGHTVAEVDRLIRHFDAQQNEHNPPGAGLLVAWLRGSQRWPIINDSQPDRPRQQLTIAERMQNEMLTKRRELKRNRITGEPFEKAMQEIQERYQMAGNAIA